MAELAFGISKSVVELLADKVKSAIKEEAEQWQIMQRDLTFITGEFEMMESFLHTADRERFKNHVVMTWVRQVRNLSYDVEDSIEFILYLDTYRRSWWLRLLPSCSKAGATLPLDEAVAVMTQLKDQVLDVSQRNIRYNLIEDAGSKPNVQMQPIADASTRALDIFITARDAAMEQRACSELTRLITISDLGLNVISVCGIGGNLGAMSIIRKVFDGPEICSEFKHRAWLEPMHPFNSFDFIRRLLAQFYINYAQKQKRVLGVDILSKMQLFDEDSVKEFSEEVSKHKYLIVLEGITTLVQWDALRSYLPDMENGSRIIVSTHQLEIASLCTGQPYHVSELRHYSYDHSVWVFFKAGSQRDEGIDLEQRSSMLMDKATHWLQNSQLLGRHCEKVKLEEEINSTRDSVRPHVVSVCGIAGVGKSTLVRNVYNLCMVEKRFEKYAWVRASHPLDIVDFSRELLLDLRPESFEAKKVDLTGQCRQVLSEKRCLVIIDHLQSEEDWCSIKAQLISGPSRSCIVVITREESVAKHCRTRDNAVCIVIKGLDGGAALRFFKEKVSGEAGNSNSDRGMTNEAELIIKKCCGHPSLIVALGSYLASQPDVKRELQLLNSNFIHEMETNIALESIRGIFASVYSKFGECPQLLKKCIFYLSVFPENIVIQRRRLVRRWIAEGYSKGTNSNSLESDVQKLIEKLDDMGFICSQPTANAAGNRMKSYEVNALFLEYIISKERKKGVFLPLEISVLDGRSSLTTERVGQHLAIGSRWERDEFEFGSLDFSRLRSLTASGEWRPFFISDKMRVLRVLDLEGTTNVNDGDLEQIGELVPRLKFLSLRGCIQVSRLPDSLGNQRQLQTLDIRNTKVITLPRSITKLQKLQYIRAGTRLMGHSGPEEVLHTESRWRRTGTSILSWMSKLYRHQAVGTQHGRNGIEMLRTGAHHRRGGIQMPRGAGTGAHHRRGGIEMPRGTGAGAHHRRAGIEMPRGTGTGARHRRVGIEMQRGIGTLKALHTLGVINANKEGGEFIMRDLKMLGQLRKLGIAGLNQENCKEFWSAISGHTHLESLSVLGAKLPQDIRFPRNLIKLTLIMPTNRMTGQAIQELSKLEMLHSLRLQVQEIEGNKVIFSLGTPFCKLKVLDIICMSSFSVEFGEQGVKELEHLSLCRETCLRQQDIENLGKLKLLRSLRLYFRCQDEKVLQFGEGKTTICSSSSTPPPAPFGELKSLEISCRSSSILSFAEGAMEGLEQLELNIMTLLRQQDIRKLGMLKWLHTLRLRFNNTYEDGEISFGDEQEKICSSSYTPPDPFGELKVLDIVCMSAVRVKFAEGAMKGLEQLTLATGTLLRQEDIRNLGKLKGLHTMCLSFHTDEYGQLQFGDEQETTAYISSSTPPDPFGTLKVLDVTCRPALHVKFAKEAMQRLERLVINSSSNSPSQFLGLMNLPSLKEVLLKGSFGRNAIEDLQRQLDSHQSRPDLKMEGMGQARAREAQIPPVWYEYMDVTTYNQMYGSNTDQTCSIQ